MSIAAAPAGSAVCACGRREPRRLLPYAKLMRHHGRMMQLSFVGTGEHRPRRVTCARICMHVYVCTYTYARIRVHVNVCTYTRATREPRWPVLAAPISLRNCFGLASQPSFECSFLHNFNDIVIFKYTLF